MIPKFEVMRPILIILFISCLLLGSCDIRKREIQLEKKENALYQKEQELLLREKTIQLKEEELQRRVQSMDSLAFRDTVDSGLINPELVGLWSVRMNCIETSCAGSAVGDVKTEQWAISYQDNNIIAKVMDKDKLVRIYSGMATNNSIELSFQQDQAQTNQTTSMVVRLQKTAKGRLEGTREILRTPGNCKIVYAIEMMKQ
jgi:hypothetical protein